MDSFRNGLFAKLRYYRRSDMANSPFHRHILNVEERRSSLFPDKRRIPGRKAKAMLTLAVIFQIWGIRKVVEIRKFYKKRELELKKQQRRSAPFFQAMNDLRYCSLEDKKDVLIKELFAHKGEDYIKRITQRYNQTDIWAPFTYRYAFMNNKAPRNIKPYGELWLSRYLHSYDLYNI